MDVKYWAAWIVLGIGAVPAAAIAAPPIWKPTGPAQLDLKPDHCSLSREFASGDERLVLQFRTTFSLATYMTTLGSPTALRDTRTGKVAMTIVGVGETQSFDAQTGRIPDRTERFLQWYSHDLNLPALVGGNQNFRFSNGKFDIELYWSGAGEAFRQFTRCHDELLAEAGVDIVRVRATPILPKPANHPAFWATNADYPTDALRTRQEGEVGFLATIGTNGTVTECRVVQSSGFPNLDNHTCSLIRRRARFEPALTPEGAATTGYYLNRVRWAIPQ